jgi:hypothetical protein
MERGLTDSDFMEKLLQLLVIYDNIGAPMPKMNPVKLII